MTALDGRAVAAALGMGAGYDEWLAELDEAAADAPPLGARPPEETGELLGRLGCAPRTVADALATLPDPERNPERWWLLDRCHRRLVSTTGDPDVRLDRWRALPDHLGLAARCFPLHWYAATVASARAWHHARGVPDSVSWATLADLGRHEAIHRRLEGTTGVDAQRWMTLHVRGLLLEVGALQYESIRIGAATPQPWYGEREAHRLGAGFRPGDPSLAVHIPTGARLDPVSCDGSMRDAATLFDEVLPCSGRRVLTCSSWLLDDQLASYLPAESNILRFQRRFCVVPGWEDADKAVLGFAFRKRGLEVDAAVAETRLQRAVLEHLASGRHFRWRTGWCEV